MVGVIFFFGCGGPADLQENYPVDNRLDKLVQLIKSPLKKGKI
jgi:hypothetical protein